MDDQEMPEVIPRGLRKHRHYEKPSQRRKHKQAAARRKGRRERYWA